jgi:hypothetical protein
MTELLSIDSAASAEGVRRQLAQAKAQRIALVLPNGWRGFDNVARMRLLLRQAQVQHCEVALVTWDEATCKAAAAIGIPVFGDSEAAQRSNWRMKPTLPFIDPRRPAIALPEPPPWRRADVLKRTARPSHHRARQERIHSEARYRQRLPAWMNWLGYGVAALFIFVLLGAFVRYILPAATVTLTPGRERLAVTFPLVADPSRQEADLEAGLLPARLVETAVEAQGGIETTGNQEKATLKASGQVIFSNLTGEEINIPAGAIVSTGTGQLVQFRTIDNANVAAGVGQRTTVSIEALEPGIEGNVRANSINNIDGPLRFRLRVNNPAAIGGGGAELKRVVTAQDQANLREQMIANVQDGLEYEALQKELRPGEWLARESINRRIVTEDFDHYQDEVADQLNLTLRLGVSGAAVDEGQLRNLLIARVQASLPERAKLIVDTLTVQRVPGVEALGSGVRFTVTVNADYLAPIDPTAVRNEVVGLSEDQAAARLRASYNLAGEPQFYRDPAFFGVLPALPSRIQVRVDYGNE